jgi:hypothetical protein
MRQGLVLKDTTPNTIRKTEVTPEVRPNPSLSLNDVQSMINSALERQAKNSDELMHRLIEERDRKNLLILISILFLLLALLILIKPIHKQWYIGGWHYNAKPISPADEPLSQSNHY